LGFLPRSSLRPLFTRCSNVRTTQSRPATTHFGNEQVDEAEKEKRVHHVFANVANKYDMMNDAMSLGIHRLWKDYYVGGLPLGPNSKVIDVAGGTGDIAFRLQKRISAGGKVTVVDINQNMLDVGQERAKNDPQVSYQSSLSCFIVKLIMKAFIQGGIFQVDTSKLEWVCANAEQLPFEENSFDAYTISFGIRNCTHVDQVVREAFRVLKPGGLLAVLEFSAINPLLRPLYDAYSFNVIPVMGQEDFAAMIRFTGFDMVRYENLTFGICAIHRGTKPYKTH
ncbi:ubiquinone/menaquinone biosynthesis methyltransferase, partial [Ancylostoma ceylanicum]